MKSYNIALFFWGVFIPSACVGLFLTLFIWMTDGWSSGYLVRLPVPVSVLLLFLLAIASTLACFIFIYLPFSNRRDDMLRSMLVRLASGDASDQQALFSAGAHRHPIGSALLHFLQSVQRREQQLLKLTKKDLLTTFDTQNGSVSLVTEELQKSGSPFDAIAVRINNLRTINDMYGFEHGDNCIKEVVYRLSRIKGRGIRMDSGDLLLLSQAKSGKADLNALLEALLHPVLSSGMNISMDVSIGIVKCPVQADSAETLFRRAWLALEQACHSRSHIQYYHTDLDKSYLRRLLIIAELESVFKGRDSEFSLFYQPKVNLDTGLVEAAEALIRWHNPVLGHVFPDEFISLAEQTGLLPKISFWVINQAIRDLVVFREKGISISVSVNVSAQDITDTTLLEYSVNLLKANELDPSRLCFELTESQLLMDPDLAISRLCEFRKHGFRVSVDDFGTGYSSLAYLKRLPIDELKIDKSFVLQLDTQPDDQSIVQTILALAKRFHLSVVAEGVEVPTSLLMLQQWGCQWVQGYLVSRPLSQAQFIEWFCSEDSHAWQQGCLEKP